MKSPKSDDMVTVCGRSKTGAIVKTRMTKSQFRKSIGFLPEDYDEGGLVDQLYPYELISDERVVDEDCCEHRVLRLRIHQKPKLKK